MKVGTYCEMVSVTGEPKGIVKVIYAFNKSVTCRNARWYERLWFWLLRKRPSGKVITY
jgi:hypothetical protein